MNEQVVFFALASRETQRVIEFYSSREEADAGLRAVLADEPGFATVLCVVAINFGHEATTDPNRSN